MEPEEIAARWRNKINQAMTTTNELDRAGQFIELACDNFSMAMRLTDTFALLAVEARLASMQNNGIYTHRG